jgi:hypothetical protein
MALDADGRIAYAQAAALISTGARARELDQMPAIVDMDRGRPPIEHLPDRANSLLWPPHQREI